MTSSDSTRKMKKKKSGRKQRSAVVISRSKSCDRVDHTVGTFPLGLPSKTYGPRTPRSILENPTSATSIRVQAEISARSLRATKSSEGSFNNNIMGTPISSRVPAASLHIDSEKKKTKSVGRMLKDLL